MFALVVKFVLKDEQAATEFDQLVADTARGITDLEPGTLVYATHSVEGEPLARIFYEVYADKAAHAEHERQPHTRRFLDERQRYGTRVWVEFLGEGPAKGLPALS